MRWLKSAVRRCGGTRQNHGRGPDLVSATTRRRTPPPNPDHPRSRSTDERAQHGDPRRARGAREPHRAGAGGEGRRPGRPRDDRAAERRRVRRDDDRVLEARRSPAAGVGAPAASASSTRSSSSRGSRVVVRSAARRRRVRPTGPLPDAVSNPYKAMTSGGSTGRPKLILANQPSLIDPDAAPLLGMKLDGTHLMPGPLYHNGPFIWTMTALLAGNHVVLGGKFDAERTLQLIDELPPRLAVPRADDDGAHLEAAARGARPLRRLVAAGRVAPRRAVPAVAQGGMDQLAGRGDDLGAVRRYRGAGRDDHHRAASGWHTAARSAR